MSSRKVAATTNDLLLESRVEEANPYTKNIEGETLPSMYLPSYSGVSNHCSSPHVSKQANMHPTTKSILLPFLLV